MSEEPFSDAPKPGDFVRGHLKAIFDYIAENDPEEFLRLQLKEYASEQFRLSYPFLKTIEKIGADGDRTKFWVKEYVIQGQPVRICSQWTAHHRPFFLNYLVERRIPVDGLSPELYEEWLARAEQAGTTAKSPGGARYKTYAIGISQNAFVRHVLSNLGHESFTKEHWEAVKTAFCDVCAYCRQPDALQMDHAIPLSRLQLGEHRLGNLVPACPTCNGKKSQLRFRPFLEAKYRHDAREAKSRIAAIEAHMRSRSYTPLEDRQDIRDLLEQAREEIAELATRYIGFINQAMGQDERPVRDDGQSVDKSPADS